MNLSQLRSSLSPLYVHYTDAVISLIGLNPHEETLAAVRDKDLARASQRQVAFRPYSHFPDDSADFTSMGSEPLPKWLQRPASKIPAKRPTVLGGFDDQSGNVATLKFFCGEKEIGLALVSVLTQGKTKALVVAHIQQHTREMRAKEARQFEGWKHGAMEELERIAKTEGCKKIIFSTGEFHAYQNISKKPIHPELLETYGRLPIQHGYKLRRVTPSVLFPSYHVHRVSEGLVWIKRV